MTIESYKLALKANDIHAVYCAFAPCNDDVYVKIGISVRPAARLKGLVTGCPMPIRRFVFAHIGSRSEARTFEKLARIALQEFHSRGEWFCMKSKDAPTFRERIRKAYRRASLRRAELKWSELPITGISC